MANSVCTVLLKLHQSVSQSKAQITYNILRPTALKSIRKTYLLTLFE